MSFILRLRWGVLVIVLWGGESAFSSPGDDPYEEYNILKRSLSVVDASLDFFRPFRDVDLPDLKNNYQYNLQREARLLRELEDMKHTHRMWERNLGTESAEGVGSGGYHRAMDLLGRIREKENFFGRKNEGMDYFVGGLERCREGLSRWIAHVLENARDEERKRKEEAARAQADVDLIRRAHQAQRR